jgi:hypothetical protein
MQKVDILMYFTAIVPDKHKHYEKDIQSWCAFLLAIKSGTYKCDRNKWTGKLISLST